MAAVDGFAFVSEMICAVILVLGKQIKWQKRLSINKKVGEEYAI